MSALLWTIAVIALINLALTVAILVSPGRPERNSIGWSQRRQDRDAWLAIQAARAFADAARKAAPANIQVKVSADSDRFHDALTDQVRKAAQR